MPRRRNSPWTRRALRSLEEPYRSRAVPPGSTRYWSWLFAAREARKPLLGIYALMAEWRALMDPGTEIGVAQIKLVWWREEMQRLAAGAPLHPITRYLADFPCVAATDFAPLPRSVEAAAAHIAGAPLEHGAGLESHAYALYGAPLLVAALLGGTTLLPNGARGDQNPVHACVAALAAAEYLARGIAEYGREARAGRILFAVDELLAAGIENDDLVAGEPPPRLENYLSQLRQRAAGYYSTAAAALAPDQRPELRHLLVLAALGAKHLNSRKPRSGADFHLADLYNAWNTARRAAAGAAAAR
jgi:phytoene synthase